jgi:hypothetical protein
LYDSRYPGFNYEEILKNDNSNDTMIGNYARFDPGNGYHVYSFAAAGSRLVGSIDGSHQVSATDSALTRGSLSLRFWGNSIASGEVDWVFATKFVWVEPVQGSWSGETAT